MLVIRVCVKRRNNHLKTNWSLNENRLAINICKPIFYVVYYVRIRTYSQL